VAEDVGFQDEERGSMCKRATMIKCIVLMSVMGLFMPAVVSHSSDDMVGKECFDTQVIAVSESIGKALRDEDVHTIVGLVPKSGLYFIDGFFEYQEVVQLLNSRSSWLYRHLFVGEDSAKDRLEKLGQFQIRAYWRGRDAVLVVYTNGASEPRKLENCLVKLHDRWYFDGIFSCD